MSDKPTWFRILHHRQVFGFSIGPTVPFILGAVQEPIGKAPSSPADGQKALHDLLRAMDASRRGVEILWCPTTQAYVACSHGNSLEWDEDLGPDIDSVAASLWKCYGRAILRGNYSKNGYWHEFTADELTKIMTVLKGEV